MTAFDLINKTFIVFASSNLDINLSCRAKIVIFKADEVLIAILSKYANFADVIFQDLVTKLSKKTKINNYTINLIDSKQSTYKPIYSLGFVEFKSLKTYIKINLTNSYVKISISLIGNLII